jgi:GTP-binding protein
LREGARRDDDLLKHKSVTFAGSASSPAQFPRDGLPEVAFLGRSNVGKSSLLNALAGVRSLARVSSDPGHTRLVNFFRVAGAEKPGGAGRGDLYLVDLPGYGYAKASREVRESFEAIAVSYLAGRAPLRLCVFIVDARHEPTDRDLTLQGFLDQHGLPYLVAANKVDALGRGDAKRRVDALSRGVGRSARRVVGTSAERGVGLDELWNEIRGAAFAPPAEGAGTTGRRGDDGR